MICVSFIGYIGVDMQFARLSKEEMLQHRIVFIDNYDLPETDLSAYEGLVITNYTDEGFMVKHKHLFEQYLAQGGVIFSTAEMGESYIPNVPAWRRSPTPIREREMIVVDREYPMFKGIDPYDLNYRQGVKGFFTRGYFTHIPDKAQVLIKDEKDEPIIYVDRHSTNGTIIAGAGTDLYQMYRQDNPETSSAYKLTSTIFEAIRYEASLLGGASNE